MKAFITHNHDSGTWETDINRYLDEKFINQAFYPELLEKRFNNGNIIDASDKINQGIVNQVICIKDNEAYSSVNEPNDDKVAHYRIRVIIQDATYRLMNNNIIGEIIYPADYTKEGMSWEKTREDNRNYCGGNLDGVIKPNVLEAILKYIYYKKNTASRGALIISVPSYVETRDR